jgi:hypothetical protein
MTPTSPPLNSLPTIRHISSVLQLLAHTILFRLHVLITAIHRPLLLLNRSSVLALQDGPKLLHVPLKEFILDPKAVAFAKDTESLGRALIAPVEERQSIHNRPFC